MWALRGTLFNCIAEFIALFCISRKIKYCLKFENVVTLPHGGQLQFRFHHSASLQRISLNPLPG
jgi:hypothetical protein